MLNELQGTLLWKRENIIKGSVVYNGDSEHLKKVINSFLLNEPNDALRIDWSEFDEKIDQIIFEHIADGRPNLYIRREDL